ncbi:MAG: IS21 family transposase [Anaerolineales bacterium]|nr:IS21 family transposase [Anaerolineales bacterium]
MDVYALLQHMRAGDSNRSIKRDLGIDRRTVRKYRAWAEEYGLLHGTLPPIDEIYQLLADTMPTPQPPQSQSTVEPYRKAVVEMREAGVEISAVWERIKEKGFEGSYMAVYRFVQQMEPSQPDVTVRVETAPGEEAQVDFGYAGRLLDPATGDSRKAWAFVMTLSWSRHQYVEFVFNQQVATWLRLHRNAFAFLGGVPRRVVIDNLKAGITKACWDDPEVQVTYRECAEHYGFLIAPCRPRTPQHKGKVEQGGVHYVKRNFLGGRAVTSITQANQDVRVWCLTTAGQRRHGTTKAQPLVRFAETEQATLQPLPETPYDLAVWRQVKLHRDCYVVFDNAYYSAPFRLVGQQLRVRGGGQEVRLYTGDYQLVATHERATEPGQRVTNPAHLPPDKLPGLVLDRSACQAVAADIGFSTTALVGRLLADPVVDRLSMVRRLLRLREQVGDARLEAACDRALRFDEVSYKTVKRILQQGLEAETAETAEAAVPPAQRFVREAKELLGHVWSGQRWS